MPNAIAYIRVSHAEQVESGLRLAQGRFAGAEKTLGVSASQGRPFARSLPRPGKPTQTRGTSLPHDIRPPD